MIPNYPAQIRMKDPQEFLAWKAWETVIPLPIVPFVLQHRSDWYLRSTNI